MYINIHIYITYINLLELYRYVSAKNPKVILRVNLKSIFQVMLDYRFTFGYPIKFSTFYFISRY